MKPNEKEIIKYGSLSGISVTCENIPSVFPPHWHNAAEFTVTAKDNCRYRIQGTEYTAMKGDVVLAWPRQLHELIYVPKDGSAFIQFDSSLIENNLDLLSISRLLGNCRLIEHKKEPKLAEFIHTEFGNIRDIYQTGGPLSESRCKLHVNNIVLSVAEYDIASHKEQAGTDHIADRSWSYIRSTCNFISEHSTEDISETDVADAVGLSPYYFSKLFKTCMQTSFPAFLASVRVKTAIRLLADENLSITDCAFLSGFQSTTTFNKAFLKVTGYRPGEYRKLYSITETPPSGPEI